MNSAATYLMAFMVNRNLTIGTLGQFFLPNIEGPISFDRLTTILFLDYLQAFRLLPSQGRPREIPVSEFEMVLSEYQAEHMAQLRKSMRLSVAFSGTEDLSELEKFASAVFGEKSHLTVSVLAHFLSNIKRKMADLPTQFHLMLLLSGPQGTGKTVAIHQLMRPLGDMFTEMSMDAAVDKFTQFFVSESFCVLFDEMAGVTKTDVEDLKRLISSSGISCRRAHESRASRYINRCSFIGTTNESANVLLRDSTGARRFFELKVLKQTNHAVLGFDGRNSQIDYLKLWQGIDDRTETKYWTPVASLIAEKQRDLKAIDPVEEFVRIHRIALVDENTNVEAIVSLQGMWHNYTKWADINKVGQFLNSNVFSRKLGNIGIHSGKWVGDSGKKQITYFKVNPGHGLDLGGFELDEKLVGKIRTSIQFLKGGK